jgi:hypothetical protein
MAPTVLSVAGHIVVGCLTAALLAGCSQTTTGTDSEAESPSATTSSSPAAASTEAVAESTSPTEFKLPAYGVEPTTKRQLTAGEITCEPESAPANTVEATSAAVGSPTVTIALPDGFSTSPGKGNVAVNLTGPEGMTGLVSIAATTLDAAAAFEQYGNDRTAAAEINSISLLPGDLCGYSGQELIGILADKPHEGIDYADRISHVWTNSGDFLIAVQLEAPDGSTGFDAARSVLLEDFGIRMP